MKAGLRFRPVEQTVADTLAWYRTQEKVEKGRTRLAAPTPEAAPHMPVCHNLLHMVRAYCARRPAPALAGWCDVHGERAAAFTANGEAYRAEYLEKINALRRLVLARVSV